jgi:hypothetical protein
MAMLNNQMVSENGGKQTQFMASLMGKMIRIPRGF